MFENNSNHTPITDGESNTGKIIGGSSHTILQMKKIDEYLNEDYCISCAYFQQTKGNFGRCVVLKTDKKFDGSKKGSACRGWRLNQLLTVLLGKRIDKENNDWIEKIRKAYNSEKKDQIRIKKENKRLSQPERKEIFNPITHNANFVHGLPFDQTSDVHVKRAYYKHKAPKKVIELAITLLDGSLSLSEISHGIKEHLGYDITRHAILCWQRKFRPEIKLSRNRPLRDEVKRKIAVSAEVQRYREEKEKRIIEINNNL